MKKLITLLLFFPLYSFAGNSLDYSCSQAKYTMVKDKYINGIAVSTMWLKENGESAMNINIDGSWYGIYLGNVPNAISYNGESLFELANVNYTLGKKVDACIGKGYIFGLANAE
ncbi:hypothetical protein ACK1MO_003421 [Salmonella enterica]